MHFPLANDQNGDPIEVPTEAAAWRVRRSSSAQGGRPHNVYDPDTGRPLQIPLDATIDDLRQFGCKPGRYRLDAITSEGRLIPQVVAVTEIADDEEEEDDTPPPSAETLQVPARVLETIERLVNTVCHTMQGMSSAFGTVQPVQAEPAAPIVQVTEPAAPATNEKWAEMLAPLIQQAGPLFVSMLANKAANATPAADAPTGATS